MMKMKKISDCFDAKMEFVRLYTKLENKNFNEADADHLADFLYDMYEPDDHTEFNTFMILRSVSLTQNFSGKGGNTFSLLDIMFRCWAEKDSDSSESKNIEIAVYACFRREFLEMYKYANDLLVLSKGIERGVDREKLFDLWRRCRLAISISQFLRDRRQLFESDFEEKNPPIRPLLNYAVGRIKEKMGDMPGTVLDKLEHYERALDYYRRLIAPNTDKKFLPDLTERIATLLPRLASCSWFSNHYLSCHTLAQKYLNLALNRAIVAQVVMVAESGEMDSHFFMYPLNFKILRDKIWSSRGDHFKRIIIQHSRMALIEWSGFNCTDEKNNQVCAVLKYAFDLVDKEPKYRNILFNIADSDLETALTNLVQAKEKIKKMISDVKRGPALDHSARLHAKVLKKATSDIPLVGKVIGFLLADQYRGEVSLPEELESLLNNIDAILGHVLLRMIKKKKVFDSGRREEVEGEEEISIDNDEAKRILRKELNSVFEKGDEKILLEGAKDLAALKFNLEGLKDGSNTEINDKIDKLIIKIKLPIFVKSYHIVNYDSFSDKQKGRHAREVKELLFEIRDAVNPETKYALKLAFCRMYKHSPPTDTELQKVNDLTTYYDNLCDLNVKGHSPHFDYSGEREKVGGLDDEIQAVELILAQKAKDVTNNSGRYDGDIGDESASSLFNTL